MDKYTLERSIDEEDDGSSNAYPSLTCCGILRKHAKAENGTSRLDESSEHCDQREYDTYHIPEPGCC